MQIKYKIKLNYHNFEPNVFLDINSLNHDSIKIDKFGPSEPLRNSYSENNKLKIIEIWNDYSTILFKNKSKFSFQAQASRNGIISITGRLEVKSYDDEQIKQLISFMDVFKKNDSLIFALFIDEDTYDEKHKVTDEYSYGWLGSSDSNFLDYLPGVYWYTYFGREYIKCIGPNKLNALENVQYYENSDSGIGFSIKDSHSDKNIIELIEDIQNQIGGAYFFSKNSNQKDLKHPGKFASYLKSLELS